MRSRQHAREAHCHQPWEHTRRVHEHIGHWFDVPSTPEERAWLEACEAIPGVELEIERATTPMPCQVWGRRVHDGLLFYFRERGGEWTLETAPPGGDPVCGDLLAEGETDFDGLTPICVAVAACRVLLAGGELPAWSGFTQAWRAP